MSYKLLYLTHVFLPRSQLSQKRTTWMPISPDLNISHDWPTDAWAINLIALLTGKALETYYHLPVEKASRYDIVKDAKISTDRSRLQNKVL